MVHQTRITASCLSQIVGSIVWTLEPGQEVAKGGEVRSLLRCCRAGGGVLLLRHSRLSMRWGEGTGTPPHSAARPPPPPHPTPPPPPPHPTLTITTTITFPTTLPQAGYFAFGGSTIVVLFQRGAVSWDEDLVQNRQGDGKGMRRVRPAAEPSTPYCQQRRDRAPLIAQQAAACARCRTRPSSNA